jgi:hypothetical protein
MSTHHSTQHEIAQPATRGAARPRCAGATGGLEKLFVTVRAHLGARRGFAAVRGPQLLS